jgi:hypothetical protein
LGKPFIDIFNSREEASWAFNFIAEVAERLGVHSADDPRIAISLRYGGKALHFVYCNWLILGFYGSSEKEQKVLLPLLKERAAQYNSYHRGDYCLSHCCGHAQERGATDEYRGFSGNMGSCQASPTDGGD